MGEENKNLTPEQNDELDAESKDMKETNKIETVEEDKKDSGEKKTKKSDSKKQKKSWFQGLKSEYLKVIWPDRTSLVRQSVAVIATAIALGIMIKVLDVLLTIGIEKLISL